MKKRHSRGRVKTAPGCDASACQKTRYRSGRRERIRGELEGAEPASNWIKCPAAPKELDAVGCVVGGADGICDAGNLAAGAVAHEIYRRGDALGAETAALGAHSGDHRVGGGFSAACEDEPSGKLTAVGGKLRTKGGVLEQTLDIRYPVTADPDWLAQRVTSAVQAAGFRMEDMQNSQPLFYPADHPLIRMLNDTCNEVLGLELKPYVIGGGTYARKLPMAVAYGHLVRSRPRPGGAGKGGGHQVDECVSIQSLEDLMRVYLRALLRLDQFHA